MNLIQGSSCLPLADWISSKKAVINPRNEERKECFKWAILDTLCHKEIGSNPQRISNLKTFEGSYDWRGLEFPIALGKIGINEQNNVSVNILAIGGGKEKLYILRKAKFDNQKRTTNFILMVQEGKRHYVAIKNINQLLASSNSDHQHKHYFCLNCLQGLQSEETKDKHFKFCVDNKAVRIDIPEENS